MPLNFYAPTLMGNICTPFQKSTRTEDKDGHTCDCPGNSYCGDKSANSKRIDYILYRPGEGITWF